MSWFPSGLRPRSVAAPLLALPEPIPRSGRALGETIIRRGSTRQFSGQPLGAAVRFFSPHAEGKDALFVTVLGRSVKGVPGTEVPLPT